jgi:hypothetical protein
MFLGKVALLSPWGFDAGGPLRRGETCDCAVRVVHGAPLCGHPVVPVGCLSGGHPSSSEGWRHATSSLGLGPGINQHIPVRPSSFTISTGVTIMGQWGSVLRELPLAAWGVGGVKKWRNGRNARGQRAG